MVTVGMRLEHFHPYLGLSYDDGILKGTNQTTSLSGNTTTIENLAYIFKPKMKESLVMGLSFPFESGGISVEGRMEGETSISIAGFVGF